MTTIQHIHPSTQRPTLEAVVSPRPELELTDLLVEGEVGGVDLAGALELPRHGPEDSSRRRDADLR